MFLAFASSCGLRKTNSCVLDIPERTTDIKAYESKYFSEVGKEVGLVTDLFCNQNDSIFYMQDRSRVVHFTGNEGRINLPYVIYYTPDYCAELYSLEDQYSCDITTTDCRIDVIGMMFGFSVRQLERDGWSKRITLEEAKEFFEEVKNNFVREFEPSIVDTGMIERYQDYLNYPRCEKYIFKVKQSSFLELEIETETNLIAKSLSLALIEVQDAAGNSSYSIMIKQRILSLYE